MKTKPTAYQRILRGIRTRVFRRCGVGRATHRELDDAIAHAAQCGAIWERQRTLKLIEGELAKYTGDAMHEAFKELRYSIIRESVIEVIEGRGQ